MSCNCHIPSSPHPTRRSFLIHRRREEAVIWKWDIVFITFICFDVLTHQKIFEHDDVSWQRPQYHPHQSPTPTNYSALKYTSLTRGCVDIKVRNVLQHHYLDLLSKLTCFFCNFTSLHCTNYNASHINSSTHPMTRLTNILFKRLENEIWRWEIDCNIIIFSTL